MAPTIEALATIEVLGLTFTPAPATGMATACWRGLGGAWTITLSNFGARTGLGWMASVSTKRLFVAAHGDTPEEAIRDLMPDLAMVATEVTSIVHALRDHVAQAPAAQEVA